MKTAVSIPDDVFEEVERLAQRGKQTRSAVFTAALREYVARHGRDEVTEAMNAVCEELGEQNDDDLAFTRRAAALTLERSEW